MPTCYTFDTYGGPFHILYMDSGWMLIHDGESLGRYMNPETAAAALAGGSVPLLPDGTSALDLHIPAELARWQCSLVR